MKWTKGPWKISNRADTLVMCGERSIASAGGFQVNVNQDKIQKENRANAQLIASAPELYEVLEYLTNCTEYPTPELNMKEAIKNARQALAKARGDE